MPNTLWTESILRRIWGTKNWKSEILLRITLLFIIWLIGAAIFAMDNLLLTYVSALGIYEGLYLPGIIVLCGAYGVQNSLNRIIPSFQPILNMDDEEYKKFRTKLESVIYSALPCIIIALIFAVFLSEVPTSITQLATKGLSIRGVWNITTALFFDLLSGTGIWMFLAIWYLILDVSRQRFRPELLERLGESLRELMKLTLYYALFYFLAVSIAVALPLLNTGNSSWVEVIFSPYLIFVAIGAASVVFPLYSIHNAIIRLKNERLGTIRAESQNLMKKLDLIDPNDPKTGQILGVIAGLQATQVKEKYIQSIPEWPVNVDFIGKLAGLIIMPTIVRIFIEFFRGYLPL